MKKSLLLFFFIAIYFSVSAQRVYFIYLESENGTPFYVKTPEKTRSSSTGGYVILSNLRDSTYTYIIGFANRDKQGKFSIRLSGNDKGFLIKEMDGDLVLFDMQNLNLLKPQGSKLKQQTGYQTRTDAFSVLLAKAANDPSLLMVPVYAADVAVVDKKDSEEKPITHVKEKDDETPVTEQTDKQPDVPEQDIAIKKTEPVIENTVPVEKKEETIVVVDSAVKEEIMDLPPVIEERKDEEVKNDVKEVEETYTRSVVRRYSESSTSEGFGLVFIDRDGEKADTIRILIPNPKIEFAQADTGEKPSLVFLDQEVNISNPPKKEDEVKPMMVNPADTVRKEEIKQEDAPENDNKDETILKAPVDTLKTVTAPKTEIYSGPPRPDCKSFATEADFIKLRRNMVAEETDEEMVAQAKKFFREKCFTSEQLRNLSTIFLTSAGKYLFFDAAYMHVSDQENFKALQSEIRDEYYLKRFKALIGE